MQANDQQMVRFLQLDFYDSLRWLFVGAVAWEAAKRTPRIEHQDVLAMYAATVQARALYEFFYAGNQPAPSPRSHGRESPAVYPNDDARAAQFVEDTWSPNETTLYSTYMARGKPANKRMFHLVYQRDLHSGGSGHDEPDHLKYQVVGFATDLLSLSRTFVEAVRPTLQAHAQEALTRALSEAEKMAAKCGVPNPIV